MRTTTWLMVLVVGVAVLDSLEANSPGFKARITNKGLEYANKVAMAALQQGILTTKIPDQNGDASGFKYSVTNIHVSGFTPPSSTITLNPGTGLTWKAANAGMEIHGDFSYKKLFFKGHGSFDAGFAAVTFNLGFVIGSDKNGRPTIYTQKCVSSIGDVNFKFHGGMSWLYNLFRNQVGKSIKNLLNSQMCNLITKEVNVDGARRMQKLKVTANLGKDYLLDYRLTKPPIFTSGYLETFHKGEIFWKDAPKESPLPVPPLPDMADSDHMIYLWVSDYMCNTMMYNAELHGALVYNLTKKDLPDGQQGVLNSTCEGLIPCVGGLIPEIGKKYPNSVVEMHMNSTRTPQMKISSSGVAMTFEGLINMYANKTGKPLAFLLALDAAMSITIDAYVENQLLYAKIKDLQLNLKSKKSNVGPISDVMLNFIVKKVLNIFLVPKLNELGQQGFPLPMTDDFKFQNTKLVLVQDSLVLATDLVYTPNNDDLRELDETLRFIPQHNMM